MPSILAAVALATVGTTTVATADGTKPISERRSAKPDENVVINNVAGSVLVTGTNQPEIVVTGTIGDGVKLEIKQWEGRTAIRVVQDQETAQRWEHNGGAELQIKLPRGSNVEISTISADITANNITGSTALQSVSGDITTTEGIEKLRAKTISGTIAISHATASLEAEAVSGDIKITRAKNLVNAQTVSGDVTVQGAELEQLSVRSVSGAVRVESSLSRDAKVRISNHSGDVTLTIPAATAGKFHLITRSGEIHNTLTSDRSKALFMGGEKMEFTTGNGTGSINVEAFTGEITLMKQ